jgi:glyoxylase-like metal-dependent hydrolase (beta-lactamase superfamily II)
MKLEKVSERIYANTSGETGGNVGVIILEDKVIAVDAQYPVSGIDFRKSVPKYSDKPVTHLLLTHIHGDHIFGNQAFEDCEIISQIRLKEKMLENLETVWAPGNLEKMLKDVKVNRPERAYLYEGLKIVLPDLAFQKKITIDGLEMISLPGHTDCSSIVYDKRDKVIFAGDLMFAETFPWAGDPTANPDDWIEAYKILIDMDVDIFIPGHGPLCTKKEFKKQLSWFKAVKKEMNKLIIEGASKEAAVNYSGYPQLYESVGDRRERSLERWYDYWSER